MAAKVPSIGPKPGTDVSMETSAPLVLHKVEPPNCPAELPPDQLALVSAPPSLPRVKVMSALDELLVSEKLMLAMSDHRVRHAVICAFSVAVQLDAVSK